MELLRVASPAGLTHPHASDVGLAFVRGGAGTSRPRVLHRMGAENSRFSPSAIVGWAKIPSRKAV